jgi:hypothetical protein
LASILTLFHNDCKGVCDGSVSFRFDRTGFRDDPPLRALCHGALSACATAGYCPPYPSSGSVHPPGLRPHRPGVFRFGESDRRASPMRATLERNTDPRVGVLRLGIAMPQCLQFPPQPGHKVAHGISLLIDGDPRIRLPASDSFCGFLPRRIYSIFVRKWHFVPCLPA